MGFFGNLFGKVKDELEQWGIRDIERAVKREKRELVSSFRRKYKITDDSSQVEIIAAVLTEIAELRAKLEGTE